MKFTATLVTLASAFSILAASAENNLFKNGDFSEGLKHWKYENKAIAIDPAVKCGEKAAVCLPGKSEIRQNMTIKPNTSYVLTYMIKGENIQAANPRKNGARFMLNANKVWQRATTVPGGACMTGSFDWTRGEHKFSADDFKGGGRLTIKLVLDCEGKCYVADVKLTEAAAQ